MQSFCVKEPESGNAVKYLAVLGEVECERAVKKVGVEAPNQRHGQVLEDAQRPSPTRERSEKENNRVSHHALRPQPLATSVHTGLLYSFTYDK